ncbi:MAG: competence/damage-inducible protein A [Betaproteobacteria bacterium]
MQACIVAVGSEMLTPFRVDTNSLAITERLNAIGYDVRLKVVAPDDLDELADVFRSALGWADLLVVTGGLGPTADDLTRDAMARVLDLPVDEDPAVVERIRARFERRGLTMQPNNRRQALVPRGAAVLPNANGTAPGLWLERGRSGIALLPGPPREMLPMLDALVRDRLAGRSGGMVLLRRVIKIAGRPESEVDAIAEPIYSRWTSQPVRIATTILAVLGQIELHLSAQAPRREQADEALASAVAELERALGPSIFSVDGRQMEVVVGDLLRARGARIAAAESCTGGLFLSRLTDVPGSSDYVEGGAICYSNALKTSLVGVPEALIAEHGAVSEPVARAMAEGVRGRTGVEIGVGITGVAGPGGGTAAKPVGTVAIAVVAGSRSQVRTFQFVGGREVVKFHATQAALNMVRVMLLP